MEEEFDGEPRIGGHDVVFVDELSPGQTCPVWLLAMRSPVPSMEEPRTDYLPQPSATASANN